MVSQSQHQLFKLFQYIFNSINQKVDLSAGFENNTTTYIVSSKSIIFMDYKILKVFLIDLK